MAALGVEIALRAHGLGADGGHDALASAGRRQARAIHAEWRDDQTQQQILAGRREFGMQAAFRGHFARSLGAVGMHLKMARQHFQRLLEFFLRGGRHGEATGHQLRGAALRGRQANDLEPLRRFLHDADQAQRFRLAAIIGVFVVGVGAGLLRMRRRGDAHAVMLAIAYHFQCRRAFGQFDQPLRRIFQRNGRMADQRDNGGGQIEAVALAVDAILLHCARHLGIPRRQAFVAGDLAEAERLRLAPATRAAFLFKRQDVDQRAPLA